MNAKLIIAALGMVTLTSLGCGGGTPAPAPVPAAEPAAPAAPAAAPVAPVAVAPAAVAVDDPKEIFKTRCVMCHGESGKGDGPASAALTPKPRDYTDPEWQKTVTDDQIKKAITEGGPAIGKSPLMPAQADLAAKPEVLNGLVAIIRGFAPK